MGGEWGGGIEQWDLVSNGYLLELDIDLLPVIGLNLTWIIIFKGNVKIPEKSAQMTKPCDKPANISYFIPLV